MKMALFSFDIIFQNVFMVRDTLGTDAKGQFFGSHLEIAGSLYIFGGS